MRLYSFNFNSDLANRHGWIIIWSLGWVPFNVSLHWMHVFTYPCPNLSRSLLAREYPRRVHISLGQCNPDTDGDCPVMGAAFTLPVFIRARRRPGPCDTPRRQGIRHHTKRVRAATLGRIAALYLWCFKNISLGIMDGDFVPSYRWKLWKPRVVLMAKIGILTTLVFHYLHFIETAPCCRWHGDTRIQGIGSKCIAIVHPEYAGLSTRTHKKHIFINSHAWWPGGGNETPKAMNNSFIT